MAEKTPNQQLAEKLLYKPAYVTDKDADVKQKAHNFAEGYKKFLDAGKTEREVAAESEQMLKDAGYQQFDPKKDLQARRQDLLCPVQQGCGGFHHRYQEL